MLAVSGRRPLPLSRPSGAPGRTWSPLTLKAQQVLVLGREVEQRVSRLPHGSTLTLRADSSSLRRLHPTPPVCRTARVRGCGEPWAPGFRQSHFSRGLRWGRGRRSPW
jgi:hypothetical protein